MGCVQQAVLEFDEEVQAPWRPRLVPDVADVADVADIADIADIADMAGIVDAAGSAFFVPLRAHRSRRSPSRVGVCRPPAVRPGRSRPQRGSASGPPAPAPAPAPARPVRMRPGRAVGTVRLTCRARRLAVILALAAGVALGSWLAPLLSGSGGGDLRLAGESSVVVEAGDTLWSIASSLDVDGDVRAVIDEIQRLNHLDGARLVPGQVLQLP